MDTDAPFFDGNYLRPSALICGFSILAFQIYDDC
jgi:hypothetical protein